MSSIYYFYTKVSFQRLFYRFGLRRSCKALTPGNTTLYIALNDSRDHDSQTEISPTNVEPA
jgi:hypothetical protein